MTKPTLKTLWFTGGGFLATWLTVTPNTTAPPVNATDAARPGVVREVTLDDLKLQRAHLREHVGKTVLKPSTRNPFRFGRSSVRRAPAMPAEVMPSAPAAPPPPLLYLSGIATEGQKRTAIISGNGQVYLAGEGELVAGTFRVGAIEADAVTLRGDNSTEIRLVLH